MTNHFATEFIIWKVVPSLVLLLVLTLVFLLGFSMGKKEKTKRTKTKA